MGFKDNFISAKTIIDNIASGAKVSKFSYDDTAYNGNTYQGVSTFSTANHNNIPVSDASVIQVNSSVVDFGFRSQASTFPRMLINHFFGRVSYNLNKIYDTLSTILTMLSNSMGEGGFAQLDGTGRVPVSQLPVDTLVYVDDWDASTNTPHLEDGVGTKGDFYIVNVAGTQTFGGVTYNFLVNDRVVYGASGVWKRLPGGEVRTVNTVPAVNGDVTLRGSDIAVSGSDSTKIDAKLNTKISSVNYKTTTTGGAVTLTASDIALKYGTFAGHSLEDAAFMSEQFNNSTLSCARGSLMIVRLDSAEVLSFIYNYAYPMSAGGFTLYAKTTVGQSYDVEAIAYEVYMHQETGTKPLVGYWGCLGIVGSGVVVPGISGTWYTALFQRSV